MRWYLPSIGQQFGTVSLFVPPLARPLRRSTGVHLCESPGGRLSGAESRKVGSPWFKSGFNPQKCGFHQVMVKPSTKGSLWIWICKIYSPQKNMASLAPDDSPGPQVLVFAGLRGAPHRFWYPTPEAQRTMSEDSAESCITHEKVYVEDVMWRFPFRHDGVPWSSSSSYRTMGIFPFTKTIQLLGYPIYGNLHVNSDGVFPNTVSSLVKSSVNSQTFLLATGVHCGEDSTEAPWPRQRTTSQRGKTVTFDHFDCAGFLNSWWLLIDDDWCLFHPNFQHIFLSVEFACFLHPQVVSAPCKNLAANVRCMLPGTRFVSKMILKIVVGISYCWIIHTKFRSIPMNDIYLWDIDEYENA